MTGADGDEANGVSIMKRVVESPLPALAANASAEGSVIVDAAKQSKHNENLSVMGIALFVSRFGLGSSQARTFAPAKMSPGHFHRTEFLPVVWFVFIHG